MDSPEVTWAAASPFALVGVLALYSARGCNVTDFLATGDIFLFFERCSPKTSYLLFLKQIHSVSPFVYFTRCLSSFSR